MSDALVLFMPSGRRGRFALGTPLLDAARALGVYVESVCGGRGLCGRCQVEVAAGVFAKHGITSAEAHLSPPGETEAGWRARGLNRARRLSCAARITGDLVIDVPSDLDETMAGSTNAAAVRSPTPPPPLAAARKAGLGSVLGAGLLAKAPAAHLPWGAGTPGRRSEGNEGAL